MNEAENKPFTWLRARMVIKDQFRNRKTILLALLSILLIFFFIYSLLILLSHDKQNLTLVKTISANQKETFTQVVQMKNQLAEIKLKTTNSASKQDLNQVNRNVVMMQSSFIKWHDQIINDIENLLVANNQSLTEKMTQLQVLLQKEHKNNSLTSRLILRGSSLPFKVTSIDVWNGQAMATVTLNGYTDLMAKGDTREGWTLVDISFDPASAVFRNLRNQMVKLNF